MASKGSNATLARNFTVIFIERPLITGPNRADLSKLLRGSRWG
jgi:hypothetical protein